MLYEKGKLNLSIGSPWIPLGPLNIFTLPPPRCGLPEESGGAASIVLPTTPDDVCFVTIFRHLLSHSPRVPLRL